MKISSPLLLLLGSSVSVSSRSTGALIRGGAAAYITASASASKRGRQGMARKRVAVVGAGAAGLAASRRLRDAGLEVKVLEKSAHVGGVWKYSKEGVVYQSLVTNLPKEIMAFPDFPFDDTLPSFTRHSDVQHYLKSYAAAHDLLPLISFSSPVTSVRPVLSDGAVPDLDGHDFTVAPDPAHSPLPEDCVWHVTYNKEASGPVTETFDAVVVANGHFEVPSSPSLPGGPLFQGRVVHSRWYDSPDPVYHDKTVLCVGYKSSGTDVAREVATVAKEVHVVDRSFPPESDVEQHGNLFRRPQVARFLPDGHSVEFMDGRVLHGVDVVLYCTGYDYHSPFLCPTTLLSVAERRVGPIYRQLFHAYWPSLACMGLLHSVVPFPLFDLQARYIAAVLTHTAQELPSRAQRFAWIRSEESKLEQCGQRLRDWHYLGPKQWEHCRALARAANCLDERLDRVLILNQQVYEDVQKHRPPYPGGPDDYRRRQYRLDYDAMTWTATVPPLSDATQPQRDTTHESVAP